MEHSFIQEPFISHTTTFVLFGYFIIWAIVCILVINPQQANWERTEKGNVRKILPYPVQNAIYQGFRLCKQGYILSTRKPNPHMSYIITFPSQPERAPP